MVSVYQDADYVSVLRQKRKIFTAFWIITAAYVVFCLSWLIYFTTLPPYPKADLVLPQVMVYAATAIYILFIAPFVGIKMQRIRKYCKMLGIFSLGIKNVEESYFMGFYKKQLQKDSVDVISCVFRTWNKKRREWYERETYFDSEREWPDLERGDWVRYVVQSNFIIQYEVLRAGAMQADIEEGVLPEDILQEDKPIFGKIYHVVEKKEKARTEETPVAQEQEENTQEKGEEV